MGSSRSHVRSDQTSGLVFLKLEVAEKFQLYKEIIRKNSIYIYNYCKIITVDIFYNGMVHGVL